ncbi:hypothetical protein LEP1GSC175_1606 [Leptospira santarosai str. HAI821]|nr:hypothetical protein LEP1GSC175_1606 [Leptospira santarosai str. HAI821]
MFFLPFVFVWTSCVFLTRRDVGQDVEGFYFSKNENSKTLLMMILSEGNGYSVHVFSYLVVPGKLLKWRITQIKRYSDG